MERLKSIYSEMKKSENMTMLMILMIVIIGVFAVDFVASDMVFQKTRFVSGMNISNVLLQVAVTGIMAIGMTLVMLMGGIDLSVGWLMCFLGTSTAYMIKNFTELPIIIIVLLAISIAIFCQFIMGGLIISRTNLEPFIISLGFMTVYRGLTYLVTNGREISIGSEFKFLGKKYFELGGNLRIYVPVLIFVLLIGIVWWVTNYTKFGRRIYAVGGNDKAAFFYQVLM